MLDPHLHYQKKKKKKRCTFKFAICTEVQNNVTSITFHVESSFTLSKKNVLSNLLFAEIKSAYITIEIKNMSKNQMKHIRKREIEKT